MSAFSDRTHIDVQWRGPGYLVGAARDHTELIRGRELCGFFEGVNTMLDFVASDMARPRQEEASCKSKSGDDFNSFATYDEAMHTYRHDPSKVRQFTEAELELSDEDAAGLAVTYSVTGDFLDVGRYLEGEPEAFGVMADGNPRSRRVNLLVNIDAVWHMSAEILNARGRRLQRLVDWLEAKSIRTAVTAITSCECAHIEVTVKHHDEVLDLNDLAVVGHGDFFRRIGFRFMEYSDTWRYGYGSSTHFNEHLCRLDMKPDHAQEFAVVVSNQIGSVAEVESEFDRVEKHLATTLSASQPDPDNQVVKMFAGSSW